MTGTDCQSVPVSFGSRMFSKHDSEKQKMSRYKIPSEFATASTADPPYEHATELQLATVLQFLSPFPVPFVPHISEFPEFASILICQIGRGRS